MPSVGYKPMTFDETVPKHYQEAALDVADSMMPRDDDLPSISRQEIAEKLLGLISMMCLDCSAYALNQIGISVSVRETE